MWPRVQFVDAPEPGANVRFDFHDRLTGSARTSVLADDWSLGSPALEGDPDAVGVQYGPRTLRFTLAVEGPKSAALAKQSAVAREMLRHGNWLLFQLTEDTAPVWFELYRAEPSELSFEHFRNARDQDEWHIGMRLPAAAFAKGEWITLPAVTVPNDPAASGGCRIELPEIIGDAPAPLRIEVNPSLDTRTLGYQWMFSLAAMEETSWSPIVWQVGSSDGWTAGTDTASPSSSPAYSGGSGRLVSFATQAGMATRISGVAPTTVRPGAYEVYARVGRLDTASTFGFRLGQVLGLGYRYGETAVMDRAASDTAGHMTWVDLGTFTFPIGNQAPDGQDGVPFPPNIALQVSRLSGSGSARLDAIMLVPVATVRTVESSTLFAGFWDFGLGDGTGYGVFDGPSESFWAFNGFGVSEALLPELVGRFPRAVPGVLNVMTVLQQVNGKRTFWAADGSDEVTASAEITLSYQPQIMWIGDGS